MHEKKAGPIDALVGFRRINEPSVPVTENFVTQQIVFCCNGRPINWAKINQDHFFFSCIPGKKASQLSIKMTSNGLKTCVPTLAGKS